MRKRSLLLLAGAVAIVASLVVGPAATAGPDKVSAGTVVFIHDQEPPNLRPAWLDNNLYATSLVLNNIWQGGQIRDNNGNWTTRLFTGPPKLVKKRPLTTLRLNSIAGQKARPLSTMSGAANSHDTPR